MHRLALYLIVFCRINRSQTRSSLVLQSADMLRSGQSEIEHPYSPDKGDREMAANHPLSNHVYMGKHTLVPREKKHTHTCSSLQHTI